MRRNSDDDARRSAAGRTVLLLFALGALVMLGAAAYGLAHGQQGQRSTLERRFQGRAQLGAALVGSLFSASAPSQQAQAAQRFGGKISQRALNTQAAAGGSGFLAISDTHGRVLAASSGAPANLNATLSAQPSFFRRALAGGSYGLSGIQPNGTIYTALPFRGAGGTRVQVSGVKAGLLSAFLGGTLKQVTANTSSSRALIVDDSGGVIAQQGGGERVGQRLHDAAVREAVVRHTNGAIAGDRQFTAQEIGATGWRLVLVATSHAVYGPVAGTNRWLPWIILVIGAIALGSVFFVLRRALAAAAQVRVANAELARSNADLERFAYVASHDLSEPLRTIGGFGGLLQRRYADRLDDEGRMMLDHVTSGATRLQALIDGLLTYARVSTAPRKLERIDLNEKIQIVLEAIRPAINERGARIEHGRLPTIEGERTQIFQLLENLILNAIKFTPADVAPHVEISAHDIGNGRVEIRIADNAIGVPADQAERIFEMFQRGRLGSDRSGTGIGLALCARIVERHGGKIRVEPRPGGGSVFVFDLHSASGGTPAATREPSEERVLAG